MVLSGTLDNGSVGLLEIKKQGGIAIVQDPKDALYDDMPRNAIDHVEVARILPISEIPAALTYFASKNVAAKTTPTPDSIEYGSKIVEWEQEVINIMRWIEQTGIIHNKIVSVTTKSISWFDNPDTVKKNLLDKEVRFMNHKWDCYPKKLFSYKVHNS